MQINNHEEIRCCHCGKLLAKGRGLEMEFKCPRCGAYTILRAERPDPEPHDGQSRANYDKGLSG